MPVGGEGMEDRNPDPRQRVGELSQVARLAHGQVLVDRGGAARSVGVAQGQETAVRERPAAEQRDDLAQAHDRTEMGPVEGVRPFFGGPVLEPHPDRGFFRGDVPPLALVAVLHRVVRIELQFIEREACGERGGVGPGQVAVEPDPHPGHAVEGGARHVVFAGKGQVDLVEAVRAAPAAVRVAEQQPLAGLAEAAADRQRVAAEAAGAEGVPVPAHGALQFEALGAAEARRGRAVRSGGREDRAANDGLV